MWSENWTRRAWFRQADGNLVRIVFSRVQSRRRGSIWALIDIHYSIILCHPLCHNTMLCLLCPIPPLYSNICVFSTGRYGTGWNGAICYGMIWNKTGKWRNTIYPTNFSSELVRLYGRLCLLGWQERGVGITVLEGSAGTALSGHG